VERLIELANLGGGPDNITCVVADLLESAEPAPPAGPLVFGAAAVAPPGDAPAG
jgi:PPM family protein phosphatase